MKRFRKLILIMLTFVLVLALPISVYADNAGGGGKDGGSKSNLGGASDAKCGYRLYVVDYNGNLKSDVIDLVTKDPTSDFYGDTTRIGGGKIKSNEDIYIIPKGMPKPYIYKGSFIGNGLKLREWMRAKGEDNQQNIVTIIEKYLGNDIVKLFLDTSEEYYCVVEPLAWHNIYTSNDAGSNSGIGMYGTFYNWMQFYSENGMTNGGFTSKLDNNILGRCLTLVFDQPNLNLTYPTGEGNISLENLGNQGFGIQLYSNRDIMPACTTYDEPVGDKPAKAPDESKGSITIIKNYRTRIGNTYTDDGCFVREQTTNSITIEDEISYNVIAWKVSNVVYEPDSINWNIQGTISQQGVHPKSVNVTMPGKALYVLLQREDTVEIEENLEADYKVTESQITRMIDLSTNDKGESILNGYKFKYSYGSLKSCPGHKVEVECTEECPEDCEEDHDYIEYCTDYKLDDTSWNYNIRNEKKYDYPKNLASNSYWSDYTPGTLETRNSLDSGNKETELEYKAIIHRGSDTLSVANWKNQNEAISSLDSFNSVSSKAANRKKADYVEGIKLKFVNNSSNTTSIGNKGCKPSNTASLDGSLEVDVDILYETYSGNPNGGRMNTDIDTNNMMTVGSGGDKVVSGRMVESGLSFSFHPYIKMQYQTINSDGNAGVNEVFVLGEYKRSIKLNDYAEIEWEPSKTPNLTLSSLQWSTHKQPYEDLGQTECLLPGGATLDIGIKKDDRQTVTVRTYQCILDGAGRQQVELTSSETISGYNKETALQYHEAYVETVVSGLKGLSLVQYQNKEYEEDPFEGIKVYNGADIKGLYNGSKEASAESKYYFKSDVYGTADSGLIDALEGNTNTVYYNFSSDTSGNILMNGTVILAKDQGVEYLTGIALSINKKTMVVDKLLDAIERNTGNDTTAWWVADGHWYNEAFDGITVAVSTTKVQTGFISPGTRTTVIDPKLNTKSYGQSFMFRDDKEQPSYNVAAFKMEGFSNTYGLENMVGEFKGVPVLMKDMDKLYWSRSFYLSNISVQDLH